MSNNKIFIGLKNDFETKITKEKVFKFIKLSIIITIIIKQILLIQ